MFAKVTMTLPPLYAPTVNQLLLGAFQMQLLHYFSKSDNKSNHHQLLLGAGRMFKALWDRFDTIKWP